MRVCFLYALWSVKRELVQLPCKGGVVLRGNRLDQRREYELVFVIRGRRRTMTEAATPHPPSPEIFKGPSENGLKFSLVTQWGVGQQDVYDIPEKAPGMLSIGLLPHSASLIKHPWGYSLWFCSPIQHY